MQTCPNCGEQNSDTAKFCQECATPLRSQLAPPQEARKIVTVLFCDLVGSTALGERLDSESLREVMDRYFTEMRAVLERHGGIVEKYIGDAVMAVFGLPRVHEDDALRAVRAASEMGTALSSLNTELDRYWGVTLSNRTGVNTGEVVVGDPSSGQRLATGDAVNVAARLEQAAPAGQVLLGATTHRLVKDAVEVEAVEPLVLKGKSEAMPAFRVINVTRGIPGNARHLEAPMVGREEELSGLLGAFEQALANRTCRLVTVLGEAGVGKSRLVAEVTGQLQQQATVFTGRCLSYGEGITFWPLAEIVRQAAGIVEEDSLEIAREKLAKLQLGQDGGVAERIASVVGLSSVSFPIEEIFWAARKLLESFARKGPLVAVFEDIHWAEATFLDWIEHVVDLADAPILVICTTRPDLLEERSQWSEVSGKASLVDLRPLSGQESEVLIGNLLGASGVTAEVGAHITTAAQGNPLFVEQIISMWIDDSTLRRDGGRWLIGTKVSTSIPPTISALLAARLDRLSNEERTVIAGASVIGQVFYRGAVEELSPFAFKPQVPTSLSALTAKQFVRPDPSMFANEEAYAFRHVLIRDAAYEAMLKRTRAALHERFASWLERVAGERIAEYEEIVGYHLEQAYWLRKSLGPLDDQAHSLAKRASRRLGSTGRSALSRGDVPAAVALLDRAAALEPDHAVARPMLQLDLADALQESGSLERAHVLVEEVMETARRAHDQALSSHALLLRFKLRLLTGPEPVLEDVQTEVEDAMALFEKIGDEPGLAEAWMAITWIHWFRCHFAAAADTSERAIFHARRASNTRLESVALGNHLIATQAGPTPVRDGIRLCEEVLRERDQLLVVKGWALDALAMLKAMEGAFHEARTHMMTTRTLFQDLGQRLTAAAQAMTFGVVEMLADEPVEAEQGLLWGYDILESAGEKGYLSTMACWLARAAYAQASYEKAEGYTELAKSAAASHDIESQASWRSVRAKLLARRKDFSAAEALGYEAMLLGDSTDYVNLRAEIRMDLGETLRLGQRSTQAAEVVGQAFQLYEQKGNIVSAARACKQLKELTSKANGEPS